MQHQMSTSPELEPTPVESRSQQEIPVRGITLRDFAISLAIANAAFFRVWWELLTHTEATRLKMLWGPRPANYIAAILDVILLAAVMTVAAFLVRKYVRRRSVAVALDLAIAFGLLLPAGSLAAALANRFPSLRSIPEQAVGTKTAAALAVALFIVIVFVILRTRKFAGALVLLPLVPVTFGQAAWKAFTYDGRLVPSRPLANLLPTAPESPRILWIIFDRMDQRLSFPDRPATVQLPEFDRLRREAVYANNAFPPGAYTITSMPALLSGQLVARAAEVDENTLLVRPEPDAPDIRFGTTSTVFSDARGHGLNVGVSGQYLPYCRLFHETLSFCTWVEIPRQHNSYYTSADSTGSFAELMVNQARSLVEGTMVSPFGQSLPVKKHANNYDFVLENGRKAAVDKRLNLVLVHFPIPHSPYFYNSRTGKYDLWNSTRSGYLHALVLADKTLGILRRDLESAGLWDRTTVLVSSDHSHRSAAQGLDGKTDQRIPFLLKLAGQTSGLEFSAPFYTVLTKELFNAVWKREITTPQQATAWLDTHRSIAESPYYME
jgi:hypothetical protein